jgi:alanyl aminopeptidase
VRQALLAQGDAVLAGDGHGHGPDFAADPDLLGSALAVAVRECGEPAVDALLAALRHHGEPTQRSSMLEALSKVRDRRQVQQVRDFALTDAVKVGEMATLPMDAHGDAATHASRWPWYTANVDRLVARSGSFDGGRLPALAASGGCAVAEAERLQAFFAPRLRQLSGADRGLAQTTGTIRLCSALRQAQDGVARPRRGPVAQVAVARGRQAAHAMPAGMRWVSGATAPEAVPSRSRRAARGDRTTSRGNAWIRRCRPCWPRPMWPNWWRRRRRNR